MVEGGNHIYKLPDQNIKIKVKTLYSEIFITEKERITI